MFLYLAVESASITHPGMSRNLPSCLSCLAGRVSGPRKLPRFVGDSWECWEYEEMPNKWWTEWESPAAKHHPAISFITNECSTGLRLCSPLASPKSRQPWSCKKHWACSSSPHMTQAVSRHVIQSMSIHSTHFTSLYSVPWCWHYIKFQGHPQWWINSRKSYSIQWQSQVYDFSLLERPSEPALIRLRCHAQKHSKSRSSCHLHKRNPNQIRLKLGKQRNTNTRSEIQVLAFAKALKVLSALCVTTSDQVWTQFGEPSPDNSVPKTSSACASNALNELCCEPRAYGLMDNRTAMLGLQKWSIQHFGGILRHCQRRLPRDGCYAAHAVREYQLVPSLRCGPIPNERPWELWHRLTKSDAIEPDSMIHEASQGKDIQKIKAFRKMPRVFPSKLKAPQFGSFPKLSFWASSFCLQLEIWTNTLSPKLTFVQIICCFYAQSFGFVSEDVWVLQHMGHKSATLDLAFDKSQQNYGEFCLLRHEWHGWQMEAFRRLPSYL